MISNFTKLHNKYSHPASFGIVFNNYSIVCSELRNINGTVYFPILYIDQVRTIIIMIINVCMQRHGGGVGKQNEPIPELLLMNPAAYKFDFVICELSAEQRTEGVE